MVANLKRFAFYNVPIYAFNVYRMAFVRKGTFLAENHTFGHFLTYVHISKIHLALEFELLHFQLFGTTGSISALRHAKAEDRT